MVDQSKALDRTVPRRDALGLAGAVAAFGAALGMNASGAKAQLKNSNTGTPAQVQGKFVPGQVKQQQKVTSGPAQAQIKLQNNQMKLNNNTPAR